MPEVLTETEGEWMSGDYGDFLGLTADERAIVESRLERSRLERAVIEKTKAARRAQKIFLENVTFANAKRHYETWEDRDRATDALIDFESQQIKK